MKYFLQKVSNKIILLVFLTIVYSCKEDTKSTLPVLTTNTVSGISQTEAVSGGDITDDGGASVTARGVCWDLGHNPSISGSHTSDGSGSGTFTSNISGLTAGTPYYVRAYATNSVGTVYGNEESFTTTAASLPILTTTEVTSVTSTTAESGGDITDDNGSDITDRGVCWSTNINPTITDPHTSDGSGTGIFTSSLISLTNGTKYYVRAYATNSDGTSYGNQVEFYTISGTDEVSIEGMAFSPSTIIVNAGTTITWTNNDGVMHTVTSNTGIFDSGNILDTYTYTRQFNTVGTYPYHCTLHTTMTGTVIVI